MTDPNWLETLIASLKLPIPYGEDLVIRTGPLMDAQREQLEAFCKRVFADHKLVLIETT